MVNDPMPVTQRTKDKEKAGSGIFLGFAIAIAFALIPTSIISFIVGEKVKNLKLQQIISGMSLISYWCANFCFDYIKAMIPSLLSIAFLYIFNHDLEYVWVLFFLFPTAIVPYTYASSFLFNTTTGAQNFTIMHHFFIAGLVPMIIYVLRIITVTSYYGNRILWIPRILPTYNV
jgi:ATP-binding cassette subfamily A (ABC1) protein 3